MDNFAAFIFFNAVEAKDYGLIDEAPGDAEPDYN